MMGLDTNRVRAVVRKEVRDYRRKRAIVVTMAVLPILFLVEPVVTIFIVRPSLSGASLSTSLVLPMLYLLLIPTVMPSTLAAYTVAGEREQGTLEPLLTTPIRQQEFIVGKATAVLIPTMVASYAVFGLFLAAVALFAQPAVATAFFDQGAVLLALFLLAPLTGGLGHCGRHGYLGQSERGPCGTAVGNVGQFSADCRDHLAGRRCPSSDRRSRPRVRRRVARDRRGGAPADFGHVRSGAPRDRGQSRLKIGAPWVSSRARSRRTRPTHRPGCAARRE